MSRLENARILALSFVVAHASFAVAVEKSSWVIVAVASDVQRIVVRNPDASLATYSTGDSIAGSDWRVARISGGGAVLEATRRYDGARLELRVETGQSIKPAAARAETSEAEPRSVIDAVAARSTHSGQGR